MSGPTPTWRVASWPQPAAALTSEPLVLVKSTTSGAAASRYTRSPPGAPCGSVTETVDPSRRTSTAPAAAGHSPAAATTAISASASGVRAPRIGPFNRRCRAA